MSRTLALLAGLGFAVGFAACSESSSDSNAASSSTGGGDGGSIAIGGFGGSTSSSTGGGGGSGGIGGGGGTGGSGGAGAGGSGGEGPCVNSLPVSKIPPDTLSATGLFADIATKTVATNVRLFSPNYKLWSDGVEKDRFIYLPECDSIDTSKMDDWNFPPGTRSWKHFGVGGKLLETRFLMRSGTGPNDIVFATYEWNDEQTEATIVYGTHKDVLGTEHDIPDEMYCRRCHGPHAMKGGMPSRILGFGAIQLSHSGQGLKLSDLIAEKKLSHPPAGNFTIPGTPVERAALGYLHVNCGSCHNDTPESVPFPSFNARLRTTDQTVTDTGVYQTMVNQKMEEWVGHGCDYRFAGGSASLQQSCSLVRMKERGANDIPSLAQMPPFGTEITDSAGLATIQAWLATLPPPPP